MQIPLRLLWLFFALATAVQLVGQTSYTFTGLPSSGFQAFSVASADFNRDGIPDLVGATQNGVDVFLATGKGTYGPRTS